MNTTHAGIEKLNMLAAAMLTALTIHTLMCGAALLTLGFAGAFSILGFLQAIWLLAGVAAGGFLVFKATSLINGRSYQSSRIAALGSLALPLLGSAGAVTAFALIPLGAFAFYLLKQHDTQVLFADFASNVSSEEEYLVEEQPEPMEVA